MELLKTQLKSEKNLPGMRKGSHGTTAAQHRGTELLYLGHAEDVLPQSPTGLTQGLDSPGGWEADPTCALGCSCHCASSSNPSWGQAFVMKPNSPDGCLLERSFDRLI